MRELATAEIADAFYLLETAGYRVDLVELNPHDYANLYSPDLFDTWPTGVSLWGALVHTSTTVSQGTCQVSGVFRGVRKSITHPNVGLELLGF